MKYLKQIALAILFGAIFTVSAYADGKPHGGGPGPGMQGNPMHFGLSDSCWNVFLSQISASDAAKLAADQATLSGNQTQIDSLNKQIGDVFKSSTGKRDTTVRGKIDALESQIETLQKSSGAAQMDIEIIIKNNGTVFQTVAENCGRPVRGGRDTTKDHGGKDTTKGPGNPNPPDKGARGHFGLSDSCWNIFLTQITAADAASLAADQQTIAANQQQIDSLLKTIRGLKGSLKDSSARAEFKAILGQINTIVKSSQAAEKDYASIIRKYGSILQSIRQDCGRTVHKGNPGGPSVGLLIGAITPNPATVGGSANLAITLTADANVTITMGNAVNAGMPPKVVFNGPLTAGAHTETFDLTGFTPGVYLITIQAGSDMAMTKLVIQ